MKKTLSKTWSSALMTAALCSWSFGVFAQGGLDCTTPTVITVLGPQTCDAIAGTYEAFETCFGSSPAAAMWFEYTPASDGTLTASSFGIAGSDTQVAIGSGVCGALVEEACNDDCCGSPYESIATAAVLGGTTYYIQWGDGWSSAAFGWDLSFVAAGGPGSSCATADPITPGLHSMPGVTGALEDFCGMGSAPTAGYWYSYTAPADGVATIENCASAVDSQVSIGTGVCGALVCETDSDDDCGLQSDFSFPILSGVTYYIEWGDGWSGSGFDFTLSAIFCTPPAASPVTEVVDCGTGTYTVEVTVTSTGDGSTVDLTSDLLGLEHDDVGVGGPYIMGPYTIGSAATLDMLHETDSDCDVALGTFDGLSVVCNEECIGAIDIACGSVTSGSNVGASVNGPACVGASTAPGVWYHFTGANSLDPLALPGTPGDAVTLSTCGTASYDTKIDVYEGSCGALVCVGGNDDGAGCPGFSSLFTFPTFVDTEYFVYISGFGAFSTGTFDLSMTCDPPCLPVPANDDCVGAAPLPIDPYGAVVMTPGDNLCAGAGPLPTCDAFATAQDVWFSFTTTTETFVSLFATALTMTDMNIVVYEGACGGIEVLCDDPFAPSPQIISTLPGTSYFVQVYSDGSLGEGSFEIGIEGPPPPPANDLCAGAIPLGCHAAVDGSLLGATATDAPGACGTAGSSGDGVWYTFMGTGSDITVASCGSTFDSELSIWDGTGGCGGLVCVAGSDDDACAGGSESLTFASAPGVPYYVYLSALGAGGDFHFEVICHEPAGPCAANELVLEINTDDFGGETSWELRPEGFVNSIASGPAAAYPDNTQIFETMCVPDGCYDLEVFDAFGDGICCGFGEGNFTLRNGAGKRIIISDGMFGASAMVATGFCVPIGSIEMTIATCDRLDLLPHSVIVAGEDPAVSAEFGGPNASTSGYQFWFFDPNGGYSRRVFFSHTNHGFGAPVQGIPTTVNHTQLNDLVTSPIPMLTFLNVRIRPRVAGVNGEFGPACTFMIDPAAAACPTTQLDDNPLHVGTTFSCGITGVDLDGTDNIWAFPVPGANWYQFEFEIPGEGYLRRISDPSYVLQMVDTWVTKPLAYGKTYNVRVRSSMDGGTTRCDWGDVCTVSTSAVPPANASNRDMEAVASVGLWPNPNNGKNVNLTIDEITGEYDEIIVEIYDAFGKRIHSETLANQGSTLNTVLNLDGDLSGGIYVVNVLIGDEVITERLIVQ